MKVWLLIACLYTLPASAEVFTYVDDQGNHRLLLDGQPTFRIEHEPGIPADQH